MTEYALALLGTIICALGFTRRPRSTYDLIRPRFVIPFGIWTATFLQVVPHALNPGPLRAEFEHALAQYTQEALVYVILCMLFFWAGYALPLGRALARPLLAVRQNMRFHPESLRPVGIACAAMVAVVTLLIRGENAWIPVESSIVGAGIHSIFFLGPLGAGLIGLAWPAKGSRNVWNVGISLVGLWLAMVPHMTKFGRGTGLPLLLAAGAYAMRSRRLNMKLMVVLLFVAMLLAHAGMYGRRIYGHYAGMSLYAKVLFSESIFSWREAFLYASGANDSLLSLCTSIRAATVADIGKLSPADWLLFQVPIPRIFGLHPEWTLDIARYSGGQGSTYYTPGMFGDTYIHLGFVWGAVVFLVIGMLYRVVDRVAFERDRHDEPGTLNPYLLFAFSSYYALATGLFNSFRAWNVAYCLPLYGLFALLLVMRLLWPPATGEALSECLENEPVPAAASDGYELVR